MSTKVSSTKKGARRRKVKVKKTPRFTSEEFNESIDIFLTTYNPYMSENCIEFDRKTQTFKPVFDYRKPVTVLKFQGTVKRKLSEGEQILYGEDKEEEEDERMRNKFNFRSQAVQMTDSNQLEHGNQTDSSLFPVLKFSGTASKAEILAAYERHEEKKKQVEKYDWIQSALRKVAKYIGRKAMTSFQDPNRKYLRLCERMLDQNLSGANIDCSFYDNPNDEFRMDFGSLLPLWEFFCRLTRGLPVTTIAWSVHFADLFAVGYKTFKEEEGDEDNLGMVRGEGYLCVYSLKGPNYPEKIVKGSSAVQCLSFHPGWSYLLAAGCDGGTLSVYDLRRETNESAGSNKTTEKILHHDTINDLEWLSDALPQKVCTVSTDGKILRWQFMLNDVSLSDDVTSLQVSDWPGEVPPKGIETIKESLTRDFDPQDLGINMAGTSMSVNPNCRDLFVVGTDTGVIYKCSFDGKRQLDSYEDHKHSVLRVHWNPYHQRVFLSSSDDMTVRIWDHSLRTSVFEFFFENEVNDTCWAPFSSTLFAAISGNAVVHVFDLAMNKKEAIGKYEVYTAKINISLTSLCFHPTKPILLVGDEKGKVISFKLSPNLRSSLKAMETLERSKFIDAEIEKMEKLLAPARGWKIKK